MKKMLPKVIIHNSISIDGSLTNFEPNMELHYQIAGKYRPNAHLIGSNTITAGIELFGQQTPEEEETDFKKPKRDLSLPYWVILDTKGILKGLLHTCRRFEYCRDVIVLISESTPKDYVEHLKERNYLYHFVGKERVNLESALRLLSSDYKVKKVITDTGRTLSNLLLEQGLASELSLLMHPVIVGKTSYNIFGDVSKSINLRLVKKESYPKGHIWLVYKIIDQ